MRLLYLCNKKYLDHKMSRGRFHAIAAIKELAESRGGKLHTWGIGWEGYNNDLTVAENLRHRGETYEVVVGYMPFETKEFAALPALKVMTYNEMYNFEKVSRQLEICRPELVICHHANEMAKYIPAFPDINFVNIPHCAKKEIFRDYGLPKTTDVLVVGRLSSDRYPLRTRMSRLIEKLPAKYIGRVHQHPGYEVTPDRIEECVLSYAKALSQARICVTCSGTPRTRYAKYVEIPRSGAVLCADLPDEDQSFFREFMIEIDGAMSDEEIISKLVYHLENREAYDRLRKRGMELSAPFTQEYYAQRFLEAVEHRLKTRLTAKAGH